MTYMIQRKGEKKVALWDILDLFDNCFRKLFYNIL